MLKEKNYILKVCCVGNGSVGKTSIVLQYCEKKFQDKYIMTIGSNFAIKKLTFPEENYTVKLQIWDIAGQKHFSFVRPPFYRGLSASILIFDITRRDSFNDLKEWRNEIDNVVPGKSYIIVGNKCDLAEERVVSTKEGKDKAEELGALAYFETSAKTGINLDEVFRALINGIINK